jgi:hypothetical protein
MFAFSGSPKPCDQTRKAHAFRVSVELSCSLSLNKIWRFLKARTKANAFYYYVLNTLFYIIKKKCLFLINDKNITFCYKKYF